MTSTVGTPAETAEGFHRLRVAAVERLTDDAVAVSLAVPDALRATYAFRAGQYLTLRLVTEAGEERRSYSICAAEGALPRIGVRRVDTGLFSEWLVDRLAAGDELEVGPPRGRFTPELAPGAHHAFVAAGSGITPVLSIASTVLDAHPDTAVTLLYGNRRSDTVMFTEDLSDLKNRYGARLHLVHVLSREPLDAELVEGRLDRAKLETLFRVLVPVDDVDQWWLCGPFGMVTDATEVLGELGVPSAAVHRELFHVDAPPPEPVRRSDADGAALSGVEATIVLNGRSTTLTLPADQPVLDGAQRVRSDLPFACRGGVCGTCKAHVSSGEADMRRNFALEADEIEAGYVLTCQTFPVGGDLVVDYDV